MERYTKLYASITRSTIWDEPMHVRVVWITMLAMADSAGCVYAAVPGLAHEARVSLEQAQDALARLESPDEHSRTEDDEGRRVETIDGGWRLVNHAKYRDLGGEQEAKRQRQQRYRDRQSGLRDGAAPRGATRRNATSTVDARGAHTHTHTHTHKKDPPTPQRGESLEELIRLTCLNAESFKNAWSEWEQHRREIGKKPYKPLGLKKQITRLKHMGLEAAIDAINLSIAQSWQGIHADKAAQSRPRGRGLGSREITP